MATPLGMIPFVVLIAVVWMISSKVRQECTFWGGFIPALGYTAYVHWDVWGSIYKGARMNSTFVLTFLFTPFYVLYYSVIGLVVGYLIGLIASFLPPFQEGKNKPPVREEGEDDKFSF